jgi:uncharacterized membrane protein (Fun14 family)
MTSTTERGQAGSPEGAPRRALAPWQKLLATLSLILTVGGLALMAVAALGTDEPEAPAAGVDALVAPGFAAGETPTDAGGGSPEPTFLGEWSPTIFRLGFSFFAAFCVAYALRSFIRIAIVAIGLLLVAIFGLQYTGLIEVDWSEWGSRYDSVAAWLSAQTASFRTFIQGALPSTGSAALGFLAGFRRR